MRSDRREIKLNQYDQVLIGASTGGTKTIKDILIGVPEDCPPIVIVQQMSPMFTQAFATKLDRDLKPHVVEASDGIRLSKGTIVVAKGGFQLSLKRTAGEVITSITDDLPVNRFKPSVDYTFLAAANLEMNQRILSIILTGMGHDGAKELLKLKEPGQMTIAQDEASSIV